MRRLLLLLPVCVGACAAVPPTGPTVMALPAPGRELQRFQGEDTYCRSFAFNQIGASPAAAAGQPAAIGSAAIGTALGAVAGGLIGSATGQAGAGAAIGAGTGLVAGSVVGANAAGATTASLQSAFDVAYAQCMTSAGNTIAPPSYGVAYAPAWPYYAYPYYAAPSVSLGFGYGYGYGYGRWRGGYPGYYGRPYGWYR